VLEGAILLKFMFKYLRASYCYSQCLLYVWVLEDAILSNIRDTSDPSSSCLVKLHVMISNDIFKK